MNVEDLSQIIFCIQSEIDSELALEKRGLSLGDNLIKLFTLREKARKMMSEEQAKRSEVMPFKKD